MSFEKDQDEFALPAGDNKDQRAANFLPKYFRTDTNKKFLNSTIDQMTTPGVIEKIDAFAGRRYAKAAQVTDSYLSDVSESRENYQLEPFVIYKDELENVEFLKDYNDYLGVIKNFRGSTSNHSIMNSQEFYAWDPHINWDKFTNFREYYWLPFGPQRIPVAGQSKEVVSTYTVSLAEDLGTISYLFNPDGLTRNPSLTLYRGQTYRFEIDTPGYPFAIAILRTFTDNDPSFGVDITQTSTLYKEGVTAPSDYVEQGVIEFTVPDNAPDSLYYVSEDDVNISGLFVIKDITENTEIDINAEIIGKKTYKTSNGVELSNGMKLFFQGTVTPEKYKFGNWYVEGVGSAIRLVSERNLKIPAIFTTNDPVPFDTTGWDTLPFDDATSFAGEKDYIVINRASADRNPWSRYNRWFHRDVIRQSAEINNQPMNLDQSARAKRPIIEFEAGLKLFNYGAKAKENVDLIDDFTRDVFSTIEGSLGYNVDGIDLSQGMRVLFTADPDTFVNGKIYEVNFVTHLGRRQIALIETIDTAPVAEETVLVLNGVENRGKMFYYDGNSWNRCQEKTQVNQSPLFDLFDNSGNSFEDEIEYQNSSFRGNKIFSYRLGHGPNDDELGFPINFRSIANLGDIVFDFNLLSEEFSYQLSPQVNKTKTTDLGYVRQYNFTGTEFTYVNAWKKADMPSRQAVIRQYTVDTDQIFPVDVFDRSAELTDLNVVVFLNNQRQVLNKDYRIENIGDFKTVVFNKNLSSTDIVLLKCFSNADKNEKGFYEIPSNLERNPLNDNVTSFTLGEVNDHVESIIENLENFEGDFPGETNLRDLGPVSKYGKKFVQHSGPVNLALFHLTDKNANIIKAIKFARQEYSRFKRQFITECENLDIGMIVKDQVDTVLKTINKDKVRDQPFYFSDMIGYGGAIKNSFVAPQDGPRFVPLNVPFDLDKLSERAVYVYVNDEMLVHGFDYEFTEGFLNITKNISEGDRVDVYEYESTNGSFVPQTPTKLGLYPCYEPTIFVDNTYSSPQKMIQGHDGSVILAFDDYRDELILELERRIFNNIKVRKNNQIFNIYDFIGSKFRNTGIAKEKINAAMLSDFSQWLEQVGSPDFTDFNFWNKDDPFTYNYNTMSDREGNRLQGYWRNVFYDFYDTDRPHLCPWEMLGFSIKPSWWNEVYGPAPYTSNNTIMWKDLAEGIIREPRKLPVRNSKFARPNLLSILPVNENGNLIDPLATGLARGFVLTKSRGNFKFGDRAPVETAWRRSAEYPFSLLTAMILLQPTKTFGLGFDTSRIDRDLTGSLVYTETGKRIRTKDIVFPCVCVVEDLRLTSGLVNYISNYMTSYRITNKVTPNYLKYQEVLKGLDSQLAIKIGGFADKNKLKLVLDSRTPLNKGNVFVPDRNYQIVFNKSSPLSTATFSGVIIERSPAGFIVRGYDKEDPVFSYNNFVERSSDPAITAGGISEPFVDWDSDREYPIGTVVRHQGVFYRTKLTHRSSNNFDNDKFVRLPNLPVVGGQTATIRTQFTTEIKQMAYGSLLTSIQEVVDFLIGYDVYLRQQGFKFDFFNKETGALEDMQLCVKEFLFWTTQNWDFGTVLTISPSANKIDFERDGFVVDDIYDTLNEINLLAGDGQKISKEFSNVFRNKSNQFSVKPIEIREGIYLAKLPLVQKEHVVLIDNITEFNDVIYDKVPGYRQERIRVVGYRTANWNGGLNIPGFFYDDTKVTLWQSWKDYAIGDLVKYKEFFYSANIAHTSENTFDANKWNILRDSPESQLFPNWDYKANQFADFYDLDSDNFDVEQQRLAQHLIGYQKRDYLSNIIVDDVSQYKFYQGYIREKGTLNSLTKLFDALSSSNKDSLEFYEEWAIRLGQYGATENIKEIEYVLNEANFRMEPQPIELTDFVDNQRLDLVYEIPKYETYLSPEDYNHKPFRTVNAIKSFSKDSGYVRNQDIDLIVGSVDNILNLDISEVSIGNTIWVLDYESSWTVFRNSRTDLKIIDLNDATSEFTVIFDQFIDLKPNDIIGIYTSNEIIKGFYKIKSVRKDSAVLEKTEPFQSFDVIDDSTVTSVSKLVKRRFENSSELNNDFYKLRASSNERVWLDDFKDGQWATLDNKNVFSSHQKIVIDSTNNTGFGTSYDTNKFNTVLAIGSTDEFPDIAGGKRGVVRVYTRPSEQTNFGLVQVIGRDVNPPSFGTSVSVAPEGNYIAISAPENDSVYIYERAPSGLYISVEELKNPVLNQSYGTKIMFRKTHNSLRLFVNSPETQMGVIYVYDLIEGMWVLVSQIDDVDSTVAYFENIGMDYDVNDLGDMLVTTTLDGPGDSTLQRNIMIYRADSNNNWTLDQRIDYFDTLESFGSVVAINDIGNKIAVGAPKNDATGTDNGCVYIYKQNNGLFELDQTLFSPFTEFNEMFGDFVDFSGNKLIVASKNGNQKFPITFDNTETTFDNNSTKILTEYKNVGKVYVYQEINDQYVYGEDLNKVNVSQIEFDNELVSFPTIEKIRFRSINNLLIVNNHIYLGLPNDKTLIDCRADINADSWSVIAQSSNIVDISQFKRCFIYSKSKNKILSDLDVIDPRQGKIAAPAEQEISFKTFYDPAVYSNNINNQQGVVVDSENAWTKENVGKLWWNLSTSSWYNPYQSTTLYRSSVWNQLIPNSRIEVCEWVETEFLPKEWRNKADTPEGLAKGISGQPLYENDVYSERRTFDGLTNRFITKYYYWVANTSVAPVNSLRLRSALEVAQLIADPESLGYRFVSPLSDGSFSLNNVKGLVEGNDSVLHFTLVNDIENENNIHSDYQLITEGLPTSRPEGNVEQKWIDSLVGYDINLRPVPDDTLSVKERYGILNSPRQGMFVNRIEAVKQFVERANGALIKTQVTDNYNLSNFEKKDEIPQEQLRLYDTVADSRSMLRFVSVARVETAELGLEIIDGRISKVNIINPGRGYKVPPTIRINTTTGSGADISIKIDSLGKITSAVVNRSGRNYSAADFVSVRKFSVLVNSDETLQGRWSIVEWDSSSQQFNVTLSQKFDTTNYWNFVDWFAEGYTDLSLIDFTIDQSFELFGLDDNIGDVVKINNIGSGGWLLLEKVDNQVTEDYSVNYKVVGRKNGTIQLSSLLYEYNIEFGGYDSSLYDTIPYDSEPVEELRNIITALRDDIFVADLAVEWNKLFFAGIRYALTEQPYVDWVFKTSFVKAIHNLGNLEQKVTFQNDNLESYEAYVNEVKPYSTKIREYVSDYSTLDPTKSMITDFDLQPSYDPVTKKIQVSNAVYNNGEITGIRPRYQNYPFKNWVDNVGFELTGIEVVDGGFGYTETPRVIISGNSGATAKAYLAKGSVSVIEITNPGSMLLSKPEIIIEGPISENGTHAKAVAIIGNSLVRTSKVGIKFDRVGTSKVFDSLETVEEFVGTGARQIFNLKWPMSTNSSTYRVYVDGIVQLSSEISVENVIDTSKGYTRKFGVVTFNENPSIDAEIKIEYTKNVDLLSAVDRINFYYNPSEGMPGKDLSQLMDGVDYDGVVIDSFGFGTDQGWDVSGWGIQWDTFNEDDDGNFMPPEESFDTALTGGSFDKLSAKGTEAGEIVVDGDGFVTHKTSKSTEELIPGQLGDVLDMKVYHRVSEGLALISSANYKLDGVETEYDLPDLPLSEDGVIVKINNRILNKDEYEIDFANRLVRLTLSPGNADDRLVVITTGTNGSQLLDFESKVFDNNDLSIITKIQWQEQFFVLITADGKVLQNGVDYEVERSTDADSVADRIKIEFELDAVRDGAIVQYAIYDSDIQTFSQILIDSSFVGNGIKIHYDFDQIDYPIPFEKLPISHNILVRSGDKILNPGYSIRYTTTNERTYNLERWQLGDLSSIKSSEVVVFADGEQLTSDQFVYDPINATVRILRNDVAPAGSELEIYIFTNAEYFTFDTVFTFREFIETNVGEEIKLSSTVSDFEYEVVDVSYQNEILEIIETDGVSVTYNISESLNDLDKVLISINGEMLDESEFDIDVFNNTVTLNELRNQGDSMRIIFVTSKITVKYYNTDFNMLTDLVLNDEFDVTLRKVDYILGDQITFRAPVADQERVHVYQFSNHDINNFARKTYSVIRNIQINNDNPDYLTRNLLAEGIIKLNDNSIDANYVWVIKNGELLSPNVDYVLEDSKTIKLTDRPSQGDNFDILQFRNLIPVLPKFGYRLFKDIVGRTHFKRLNQENSYVLAEPLNYYDIRIKLEDATGIQKPNRRKNIPGVVFVDGERIEYFEVKGNTLLQLRRGTLGTSIKEVYDEGTRLFGQGSNETVKYKDQIISKKETADGIKNDFDLGFSITNQLENYTNFTGRFNVEPTDFIDVFVGGRKLRRKPLAQFDSSIDQDSPEADIVLPAEYEIDISQDIIVLDEVPANGVTIEIVRRIGKIWNDPGKSLAESDNGISKFLRGATIELPK